MAYLIDAETVLSGIEQWLQLEQQWGTPIDLDDSTLEDYGEENYTAKMKSVFSSLDLKKSTFDSSFVFKKSKRKAARYSSKKSVDYKEFLNDLKSPKRKKPFFYISGEILSAASVEEICEDIDDVFKSVEMLCSATSTIRFCQARRKPSIRDIVHCSISTGGLSFDDTVVSTSEDQIDVEQYIDEAFDHLHSTIATLSNATLDKSSKETVTTLVRKFTRLLKSPEVQGSPGLRRQCGDKFKDLAAFWHRQASSDD